jgi:hypothetical protein
VNRFGDSAVPLGLMGLDLDLADVTTGQAIADDLEREEVLSLLA